MPAKQRQGVRLLAAAGGAGLGAGARRRSPAGLRTPGHDRQGPDRQRRGSTAGDLSAHGAAQGPGLAGKELGKEQEPEAPDRRLQWAEHSGHRGAGAAAGQCRARAGFGRQSRGSGWRARGGLPARGASPRPKRANARPCSASGWTTASANGCCGCSSIRIARPKWPPCCATGRAGPGTSDVLWLPLRQGPGAAGPGGEAHGWYRRYLDAHPQDWLVQAPTPTPWTPPAPGRGAAAAQGRHAAPWPTTRCRPPPSAMPPTCVALQPARSPGGAGPGACLAGWLAEHVCNSGSISGLDALSQNNDDGLKGEWLAWAKSRV